LGSKLNNTLYTQNNSRGFDLAVYTLHSPSPFNCSGLLSSNQSLQIFFHPIRLHLLNTTFSSSKSLAANNSFWAAFKSSRDAIAGISNFNHGPLRLRIGPWGLEVGGSVLRTLRQRKQQRASSYVPPCGTTKDK